jgi:hypothetical protein
LLLLLLLLLHHLLLQQGCGRLHARPHAAHGA